VFHVHFHIIPKVAGQGLGIDWQPIKTEGPDLKALSERIVATMASPTR
jgi:diadenosine tetraphosphate (Ap4A) HIT family hydrolase